MQDHYATLGVNSSATADEIRRAYRILARRYHPDVNPGKASEDKFKTIAEAYDTLSDPQKKSVYDLEYERHQPGSRSAVFRAYQRHFGEESARERYFRMRQEAMRSPQPGAREHFAPEKQELRKAINWLGKTLATTGRLFSGLRARVSEWKNSGTKLRPSSLSVIEVSLSIKDAITGVKKTIEIPEPEGTRKVSVRIPPGVRNGSVVRLQASGDSREELILIVRLASHPLLHIEARGLVMEIPITVNEAISGASLTVPTLDEPMAVKIAPGTQSGQEMRLKEKGIITKDGARGDLFLRFLIRVPESSDAVGIKDKAGELDLYYGSPVRRTFPANLLEL